MTSFLSGTEEQDNNAFEFSWSYDEQSLLDTLSPEKQHVIQQHMQKYVVQIQQHVNNKIKSKN